jgi:hypothetical protein
MLTRNLLLILIALLLVSISADASLYFTGETVVIAEEDTLRENAMITGKSVSIYADIFGDVISGCRIYNQYADVHDNVFLACQTADFRGNVGDILVFGQTINVKSDTTGDIRGAAQTVNIYGYVDGDVIVGAESVYIASSAVVTGDVFAGGSEVSILGEVYGDVKGGMEMLTVGNVIHGNVEVWSEDILFSGSGEVKGDLEYHAEVERDWNFSRNVDGRVRFLQIIEEESISNPLKGFALGLLLLITALVTAFLMVALWKRGVEGSLIAMDQKKGMVIISGLLGFAATPMVALFALILVITFPIGIMLFSLYPILLYFGWVFFGIWVGKTLLDGLLRRDVSLWAAAPVGVLTLGILVFVPYVGLFIALVSTVLGMGMLIMQMVGLRTLRTW